MNDPNLPQRTPGQKLGAGAAFLLQYILNKSANPIGIPQQNDFGLDIDCELFDDRFPTGIRFNVQSKGVERLNEDRRFFSVPVETSTLNYWLMQGVPTFVMLVDEHRKRFYWAYPREYLNSLAYDWAQQGQVSIRVSLDHSITLDDTGLPPEMLDIIKFGTLEANQKIFRSIQELHADLASNALPSHRRIRDLQATTEQVLANLIALENIGEGTKGRVIQTLNQQLGDYWTRIAYLDNEPSFREIMRTGSIYSEPFGAGPPEEVIPGVRYALNAYDHDPSAQNYSTLLMAAERLAQLNRDIAGTLYALGDPQFWE